MKPTQSLGFVVMLIIVQSAPAQNRFILRTPASSAAAIVAAGHNLTFVRYPDAYDVAIVQNTDTRTINPVGAELSADPSVLGIEPDNTGVVSDVSSGAQLSQSTAAILDALPHPVRG